MKEISVIARAARECARETHGEESKEGRCEKTACWLDGSTIRGYWKYRMKNVEAVEALGALANAHRLAIYRLLVQAGPAGRPAGAIAEKLDMPASSLSFHLAHLTRAGLIEQRRESRSLVYSADFDSMNGLVGFLTENCCGASCAPAASTRRKAS
ncbi:arsenical resistance operon repressor [alpha proteobacterium U9-1i]|nr:arsenical resistance operon repressor [alpha proteobacterium U9-1i]